MMIHCVLGIGFLPEEHQAEKEAWGKYGILFEFAENQLQAFTLLKEKKYSCVVICTDFLKVADLIELRSFQAIPIVVMPPAYSAEQRQASATLSAVQYIHAAKLGDCDKKDIGTLRSCFEPVAPDPKPLTIITVKDMSFCLEYRSVEIRGEEVSLTEKEFDILTLLLTNPKKVFTYEMIMDAVWHEDMSFYSPKAITTHISNLRRKLKTAPDVPEYIKSVRGVGYKFEIPR